MRLLPLLLLAACVGPKATDDSAPVDRDGDGYAADDCDDNDATIHPEAQELCGGVDEDCDGVTDEADAQGAQAWYPDGDGDGFGDPQSPALACTQPAGLIADHSDCDDADPLISPVATEICDGVDNNCDGVADEPTATDALTWYADADGDSFGDPNATALACTQPEGFVADDTDCDDSRSSISPGASEICDSLDNDCDTTVDESDAVDAPTWYTDADQDGFGDPELPIPSCTQPSGTVADSTDCDDSSAEIYPGAEELCDAIDNNCDATIDEDTAADAALWYADSDADAFGDPSSPTASCAQPSGFVADDTDCDDSDPYTNPGAPEVCGGGDEDCDNVSDEDDAVDAGSWHADNDNDGFGDPNFSTPSCTQPSGFVADATDCDDNDSATNPASPELCGGGDEDCDSAVDESSATDALIWYADADGDGYGSPTVTTPACTQPSGFLPLGTDCDDADPTAYPNAPERCGGGDEDCDSQVDEQGAVDILTWYIDLDSDGFGEPSASLRACQVPSGFAATEDDCDDGDVGIYPNAPETCGAPDQDCDGRIDDPESIDAGLYFTDNDGDGYGDATAPLSACGASSGVVSDDTDCDDNEATANPGGAEECWNGIDEDCDPASASCTPGWSWLDNQMARIYGTAVSDRLGMSFDVGDLNRDGAYDLALGSYASKAYVAFGPFSGDRDAATSDLIVTLASDLDPYISSIQLEDVDNSGSEDLILGVPYSDRGSSATNSFFGAVLLFCNPVGGALTDANADTIWIGDGTLPTLGWKVGPTDDIDGDTYPDLAVLTLSGGRMSNNRVLMLSGADRGTLSASSAALSVISPDNSQANFGQEFQVVGDLDGDGSREFLVDDSGATRSSTVSSFWVVPGQAPLGSYTIDNVGFRVVGVAANGSIESMRDAGDLNADGYGDLLIVGGDTSAGGMFWVMLGPLDSSTTLGDAFGSARPNGWSIDDASTAGDLNGDGQTDVAAYVGSGMGRTYIYLDIPQGYLDLTGYATYITDRVYVPYYFLTNALDIGHDFDGDGMQDLLLVRPLDNTRLNGAGMIHLLAGTME